MNMTIKLILLDYSSLIVPDPINIFHLMMVINFSDYKPITF